MNHVAEGINEETLISYCEPILFDKEQLDELKELTINLPETEKIQIRKMILKHKANELQKIVSQVSFFIDLEMKRRGMLSLSGKEIDAIPENVQQQVKEYESLLEEMAGRMANILLQLKQDFAEGE